MDFSMRRSRVLAKLRAGEVVYSFKVNLRDTRCCEIVARHGFDCIWTCMEHIPNDWSVIEAQVLAAKCYDVDLLCRVARGCYSNYIRPLEMDATGIMVPHIMSIEDAREVVHMTRFGPIGRRPTDGGNADGAYCAIPHADYLRQANEERFIVFQIEDPEALPDLEKIAELPGYDVLLFGAGDFSHALGIPGQMDDPRIIDTYRAIAETAIKHGKVPGAVASPETRQGLLDMGYRFLNMGADVHALNLYCSDQAAACGITTGNQPVTVI